MSGLAVKVLISECAHTKMTVLHAPTVHCCLRSSRQVRKENGKCKMLRSHFRNKLPVGEISEEILSLDGQEETVVYWK